MPNVPSSTLLLSLKLLVAKRRLASSKVFTTSDVEMPELSVLVVSLASLPSAPSNNGRPSDDREGQQQPQAHDIQSVLQAYPASPATFFISDQGAMCESGTR